MSSKSKTTYCFTEKVLKTKNESIANKIKTILNVFKDDGVKVQELKTKNQKPETILSDEYIEKHWKELIMTSGNSSNHYKSEQYYEDRAEDYRQRGKV